MMVEDDLPIQQREGSLQPGRRVRSCILQSTNTAEVIRHHQEDKGGGNQDERQLVGGSDVGWSPVKEKPYKS